MRSITARPRRIESAGVGILGFKKNSRNEGGSNDPASRQDDLRVLRERCRLALSYAGRDPDSLLIAMSKVKSYFRAHHMEEGVISMLDVENIFWEESERTQTMDSAMARWSSYSGRFYARLHNAVLRVDISPLAYFLYHNRLKAALVLLAWWLIFILLFHRTRTVHLLIPFFLAVVSAVCITMWTLRERARAYVAGIRLTLNRRLESVTTEPVDVPMKNKPRYDEEVRRVRPPREYDLVGPVHAHLPIAHNVRDPEVVRIAAKHRALRVTVQATEQGAEKKQRFYDSIVTEQNSRKYKGLKVFSRPVVGVEYTEEDVMRWIFKFRGGKRASLLQAREALDREGFDDKRDGYYTFMAKWEKDMPKYDGVNIARLVCIPSFKARAGLGPFVAQMKEQMKRRMNFRHYFHYPGSMRPDHMGVWMTYWLKRLKPGDQIRFGVNAAMAVVGDDAIVLVCTLEFGVRVIKVLIIDFSKFDAHQDSIEIEGCTAIAEQLFKMNGVEKQIYRAVRRARGWLPDGTFIDAEDTMPSGKPTTTDDNVIRNVVAHACALEGAQISVLTHESVLQSFAALGYKITLSIAGVEDAEFCSKFFVPIEEEMVDMFGTMMPADYRLTPKPGRMIAKLSVAMGFDHAPTRDERINYFKSVLFGYRNEVAHVPGLGRIVTEIASPEAFVVREDQPYWRSEHAATPNLATAAWFERRYPFTGRQLYVALKEAWTAVVEGKEPQDVYYDALVEACITADCY